MYNDARADDDTPSASCNGCVQWWPERTATPSCAEMHPRLIAERDRDEIAISAISDGRRISGVSRRDLGAISRLVEECREVGRMNTLMIKRDERRAIGTRGRRWAVERQPGDLG